MADIITSLRGGMFDSTSVEETVSGFPRGNKAVDSDFFAQIIRSFYADGVLAGTDYAVLPSTGMKIKVKAGVAWIRGYMAWLPTDTEITLESAKTYAVVVRLNLSRGEYKLVVTEDISSLPTRTDSVSDLVVASITVPAGTTAITAAMITDRRADATVCGYVRNAVDSLGEANHSIDSDKLGGTLASRYLKKDGGTMNGSLIASAGTLGSSEVRNISYGTAVPSTLADGEIFILLNE